MPLPGVRGLAAFAHARGDLEDFDQELAVARWLARQKSPGVSVERTARFRAVDFVRSHYGHGPLSRAVKGALPIEDETLALSPDAEWRAPFDAVEARVDLELIARRAVESGAVREGDVRTLYRSAAGETLRAIGESDGITESGAARRRELALEQIRELESAPSERRARRLALALDDENPAAVPEVLAFLELPAERRVERWLERNPGRRGRGAGKVIADECGLARETVARVMAKRRRGNVRAGEGL